MYEFSSAQRMKALRWLVFWHMSVIVASNYLVQFPFKLWGLDNTWGAFTFPFIFLTTDLTVRIFGALLARKIIFWVMLPSLVLSYVISVVFEQGQWAGWAHLAQFNVQIGRIALASFSAYVVGQLMDIMVFNRLRQLPLWWVAPSASALLGGAIDTLVFFSVAFYHGSDAFMAANWFKIGLADYGFKIGVAALFFLPAYGMLLRFLLRKLTSLPLSGSVHTLQSD
ncbi:7-cyano-7-deazaguanine/7-aminomethyl-7-deazaguanine transporter [Neisseriaceae bacterium ESL0693]|nr:7-cyano-7-deazaguanine/7-aminomethyl-7-deazaguanine transporter [Neisseriaceae bacterium ESL0693]